MTFFSTFFLSIWCVYICLCLTFSIFTWLKLASFDAPSSLYKIFIKRWVRYFVTTIFFCLWWPVLSFFRFSSFFWCVCICICLCNILNFSIYQTLSPFTWFELMSAGTLSFLDKIVVRDELEIPWQRIIPTCGS